MLDKYLFDVAESTRTDLAQPVATLTCSCSNCIGFVGPFQIVFSFLLYSVPISKSEAFGFLLDVSLAAVSSNSSLLCFKVIVCKRHSRVDSRS